MVRLPDVYARIHASGVVDTGGAAMILLGLCLYSGWNLVTVKLVVIGVFLFFTSPISGHAIAQLPIARKWLSKAMMKLKPAPVQNSIITEIRREYVSNKYISG